jgi:hypothetical protein
MRIAPSAATRTRLERPHERTVSEVLGTVVYAVHVPVLIAFTVARYD